MRSSITAICLILGLVVGCSGGGGGRNDGDDTQQGDDGGGDDGGGDDGGPGPDAGDDPVQGTCDPEYIGGGDGCDCGCGVADPDCSSPLTAAACEYDNCPEGYDFDPADPTHCVMKQVPAGWDCDSYAYGEDAACSCGCGAYDDKDCTGTLTLDSCESNACPVGQWPDPADPTACVPQIAGWTCSFDAYYDDDCDCGCGIKDPSCPANATLSQCDSDLCPSGQSPDPTNTTQCMSNAPQDNWTCDLALLGDGQCDCGCGSIDIDCPANPTPASCDEVHCGSAMELKPGNVGKCWEVCNAPEPAGSGNASCSNHSYVAIGGSCVLEGRACTDGRTYQVECSGSECTCSINGACVAHATGGGCQNLSACDWNVTITSF